MLARRKEVPSQEDWCDLWKEAAMGPMRAAVMVLKKGRGRGTKKRRKGEKVSFVASVRLKSRE
jgi:hypothetical protein